METENKTSKGHIKEFIDTVSAQKITYQNYNKPHADVMNKYEMIEAQIDNLNEKYKEKEEKYKKYIENKEVKNLMMSDKIVPIEVHNILIEMENILSQMADWKILQCELIKIDDDKLATALSAVRGMDIEKEVLTNMKEVLKQRDDMMAEILNEKIKLIDEKQESIQQGFYDRIDGTIIRLTSMFMNNIREMYSKSVQVNPTAMRNLEVKSHAEFLDGYEKECEEKDKAYKSKQASRHQKDETASSSSSQQQAIQSDSVDVSQIRREGGKYSCPVCPEKGFENINVLTAHVKTKHPLGKSN